MDIVTVLDQETWKEFVESQPHGNVFHTPEMFRVFAQAKGHCPQLWAAVQDGNTIQALFTPIELTLYGGPLRALTSRLVAYGGVVCNAAPQGCRALKELLTTFSRHAAQRGLFTEMRNLADTSSVQPILQECGFRFEEHLDYIIDLNGAPEDLLRRIGPRTRKHIRQGLRRGHLQVREITSREDLPVCYSLLEKTYRAAAVPLAHPSLFESAFEVLQPLGMAKFWLGTIGTTPVSTSVELLFKDVIYGWYGGVDRTYAEYSPGELTMWHILRWGSEHGFRVYDFGGAGRPGETYKVRDFKAKFGGELVCYGRNICVHSPRLFRASTRGYELYRWLLGWRAKQRRTIEGDQQELAT